MEWFEDEAFWVDFSDVLFSPARAAEAAGRVATSPLLDVPDGAAVLDLGCGPGTHAVPLALRGARVTGVDLSAALLDRARAAAAEAGADARFVRADMREFVEPDTFDLVTSMFTSFGLFADEDENRQVLRNAHRSLVPGGRLLVDLYGKEMLARDGGKPQVFPVEGGTMFTYATILGDWDRFRIDFAFVQGDKARWGVVEHELYSAVELKALFAGAGFVDIDCFGGFDAEPFDNHAQRLIVRGRRPS